MRKHIPKRIGAWVTSLALLCTMSAAAPMGISAAESQSASSGLRTMEYLDRGLVAAETADGIFLSWRFLGDEPDGLSWNLYRKDAGDADFKKIATITPQDVAPESNYETNPGIVKENTTPSNYTDPDGKITSEYEVAPVIDGVEGRRQGLSVPMLSSLPAKEGQEDRAAVHYIPLKVPDPIPVAQFHYRGKNFGAGIRPYGGNETTNADLDVKVDTDIFNALRTAYNEKTVVTQEQMNQWVATLGEYTGDADWALTNAFTGPAAISDAQYAELKDKYMDYYDSLASWEIVDMDLLRAFREPHDNKTPVTQEDLNGWVAQLNAYNETPNRLGVATYDANAADYKPWAPSVSLGADGLISDALYSELESEFIKYIENLDEGTSLPYAMEDGKVVTRMSDTVGSYVTGDMTTADFDGDGEYEIVLAWRVKRPMHSDPLESEPLRYGHATTGAPVYIDVYKLDGSLLFRVDMGYNVRSTNGHETTMFAQDFDGDGKAELMLKTGLGTRIGHWDEAQQTVVYDNEAEDVVGGEIGLESTTDAFINYFETGNTQKLDEHWAILNSFTISYRSPIQVGGNDGVNDKDLKRWIKTYHVGPTGPAPGGEWFTAFKYDANAGEGYIIDSTDYPHKYAGSVDGDNWAMTPETQRGNFSYLAFPHESTLGDPEGYKAQFMDEKEAYWLENPWKQAVWGDAQGNRASRFTGVVASLDGQKWYAVSNRGYYARTTLAAFTIDTHNNEDPSDDTVELFATFDSADSEYWSLGGDAYDYQNRGNHQIQSGDLDGDGKDEVLFKGMTLKLSDQKVDGIYKILPLVLIGDMMPLSDDYAENGLSGPPPRGEVFYGTEELRNSGMSQWAPLRHGDYSYLLPADKSNKLLFYSSNEEHIYDDIRTGEQYGWMPGITVHDPLVGNTDLDADRNVNVDSRNSLIFGVYAGKDETGTIVGKLTNRFPGVQTGSAEGDMGGVYNFATGERLTNEDGSSLNNVNKGLPRAYAIWFGGGLTQLGINTYSSVIRSFDPDTLESSEWLQTGIVNGEDDGADRLPFKVDLWGDWREELVGRYGSGDDQCLGIVTSLIPTDYGIRTLMHDPLYRQGVASQNGGYNSPGFPSFYLGDEAPLPQQRTDIYVPSNPLNDVTASTDKKVYAVNETITVTVNTDASVSRVVLQNEGGSYLAVDGTYDGVDNGDNTKTFQLTFALGTVGERSLIVHTAGDDGKLGSTGTKLSFTVSNTPIAPPAGNNPQVLSAGIASGSMKVNAPITFQIKTNTDVTKVALFNESGAGLVSSSSYVDNGNVRTWTLTLSFGSAGARTLTVKCQGAQGIWLDSGKTVKMTLQR